MARGIVHTARGILVVKAEGRSAYTLVGGRAKPTETRYLAMRREAAEEVSLHVVKMQHIGYHTTTYKLHVAGVTQKSAKLFFIWNASGCLKPGREIVAMAWWRRGSHLRLTCEARDELRDYMRLRKLLRGQLGHTKIDPKKKTKS